MIKHFSVCSDLTSNLENKPFGFNLKFFACVFERSCINL